MKWLMNIVVSGAATCGAFSTSFAATDASSLFDAGWSAMGFVLGYGSQEAYVEYACKGTDPGATAECNGPPKDGLVRKLVSMIESTLTVAELTVCKDIPLTGTKSVSLSGKTMTLTFGTPTQKIPAAWTGGGKAFDRRIEFSAAIGSSSVKMVVEGSCEYDRTAFVAMNMAAGQDAPNYTRPINVWFGTLGDSNVADIYVAETNSSGRIKGAFGFSLKVDESTKTYQIWGSSSVRYDDNTSDQVANVLNLTGNYADHKISLKTKRFVVAGANENNVSYYNTSTLAAMSGASSADIATSTNFNLLKSYLGTSALSAGQTVDGQGCMDFDLPTTQPTAATACTGLDWSAAPVPVGDATGTFSTAWVFGTMPSKLVQIPSL